MKKLILTICFCLMTSLAFADINIDSNSSIKNASENTIYGKINIEDGGSLGDKGNNIILSKDIQSKEITYDDVSQIINDHWVYIRLEDRLGVTSADTPGRSKRGDIVDIRLADYEPSAMEIKEYAIVKVTGLTQEYINEYKQAWFEESVDESSNPIRTTKAYRKYVLKNIWVKNLSKGIFPQIINVSLVHNNIRLKDDGDIALYKKKQKVYMALRPLRKLQGYITYAWQYWVRPAYASVACADDSTAGEQVCTINKTGEDYATVTLWEDAKDGDLVTAQQIRTAEVYNDDGDLPTALTIDGSTTNATYYLKVTSPVGERHNGTVASGATLTRNISSTNQVAINVLDDFTVIEWLIVEVTFDNASETNQGGAIGISMISGSDTIRNNIVRGIYIDEAAASSNNVGINVDMGGNFDVVYVYNNIVYGFHSPDQTWYGISAGSSAGRVTDHFIYNNTMYGNGVGLETIGDGDADFRIQNNVCVGNTTDFVFDVVGPAYTENDYNCSEDATATGANSITTGSDTDFVNVTAGNENLHLATGAVQIDEGVDLGTGREVEIDIDGRDRDAEGDTWDIGADEYVAAAVEGGPPGLHLYDVVIY